MRSRDLTATQLEIVMYLANGMTFDEIATTLSRSTGNVKKHAGIARRKTNCKTLPQLVSVVIASGKLDWDGEQRSVNGDGS
jgi:DNA-binding CsgD family transcriptional regulator